MIVLDGKSISDLFDKKERKAQSVFPALVRKLIRASVNTNGYTHFPDGDAIYTPGWDGIVKEVVVDHRFIPKGDSIWEIGTNKGALEKIRKDYQKRKKSKNNKNYSNYSYIAVTSRVLDSEKMQSFCDSANDDRIFSQVLILDANSIAEWLGDHIEITIWLLKEFGEKISNDDITLLIDEWKNFSAVTKPNLPEELFLLDNETIGEKLIKDIESQIGNDIHTITSQYFGKDYAYAFALASLQKHGSKALKERCITVNSQAALCFVDAFCRDKLVLLRFNIRDGKPLVDPKNTYLLFDSFLQDGTQLKIPSRNRFVAAVESLGFTRSEAESMSYSVDGNVLALRRLISRNPIVKVPEWSRRKDKTDLIPLLLMGEINTENEGDIAILKTLVGETYENYLELLDFWSEIDESPIYKYESVYRICARKECFENIQIDINSPKIKRLIAIVKSIITGTCSSTETELSHTSFSREIIFRDQALRFVFEGFILLAEKTNKNQRFFDWMSLEILNLTKQDKAIFVYAIPKFRYLAELSPQAYLYYLKESLESNKELIEGLFTIKQEDKWRSSSTVQYFLSALKVCLQWEDTAQESYYMLLKLYYGFSDCKELLEMTSEYIAPISTLAGVIPLSLSEKLKIFWNFAEKNEDEKTKKIVDLLHKGNINGIVVPVYNTFRKKEDTKISVTMQDMMDLQNSTNTWLVSHSTDKDIPEIIRDLIHNIHVYPSEKMKEEFAKIKSRINEILDVNVRKEICSILRETKEDIKQFPDWKCLEVYLPVFDELISQTEPHDLLEKYDYILSNDNFPLDDPPLIDIPNWFDISEKKRSEVRKDVIEELKHDIGEGFFNTIVNRIGKNAYHCWGALCELSNDFLGEIKTLIKEKNEVGLKCYLSKCGIDGIKQIIESTTEDDMDLLFRNLPYRKDVVDLIDGQKNEEAYWKGRMLYVDKNMSIDRIFDKCIKYNPISLLQLSYSHEFEYDQGVRLIEAILEEGEEKLLKERNSIRNLVDVLDTKHYTEELSRYEFLLLPYLMTETYDFPVGIQTYFWKHPEEISTYVENLIKNNQTIIMNLEYSIGKGLLIPQEYMISKRGEVCEWVKNAINASREKTEKVITVTRRIILNVLVQCPKTINEKVWPIREIASAFEEIVSQSGDNPMDVARDFEMLFMNRRGVRTVDDGTPMFTLAEEFSAYQREYRQSHPVMSQALGLIAEEFKGEGERDRKQSILGYD